MVVGRSLEIWSLETEDTWSEVSLGSSGMVVRFNELIYCCLLQKVVVEVIDTLHWHRGKVLSKVHRLQSDGDYQNQLNSCDIAQSI
jgi:hypothetical protein